MSSTTIITAPPAAAPTTDTGNKIKTGLRYVGANATGALTLFVALGTLSPDQQTQILSSAHTMYQSTHDFVGAAANIWYIVFPVLAIWLGKMGVNSSGFGSMMDKIFAAAKSGDENAKTVLLNAAASPEIGTTAIINKEMAAVPATAGNVVSTPEAAARVAQTQ